MNFELTEQQIELRDAARKLANDVFKDKAARWDREEVFPEENKKPLCELGYLGLSIDEKYGGSGMVRDLRMLTITGGTTQTQKNAIANHIFPG